MSHHVMVEDELIGHPCEKEVENVNTNESNNNEGGKLSWDVLSRPGRYLRQSVRRRDISRTNGWMWKVRYDL